MSRPIRPQLGQSASRLDLRSCRSEMNSSWRRAARSLTAAALPADIERPGTWPVSAALLPHVQVTHPADSDAMVRAASFLLCSGNYTTARVLQQQIADARERVLGARVPRYPRRPRPARPLGRGSGRCGGPRPVRRAAASPRAGVWRRAHPHPDQRAELAYWTGQAEGPAFGEASSWQIRGQTAASRAAGRDLRAGQGSIRAAMSTGLTIR